MNNLIIFKSDLESFAAEAHEIVWTTIAVEQTQHFATTYIVLSAYNKEGRAIQLRSGRGEGFASDQNARQIVWKEARKKLSETEVHLGNIGFEIRDGVISSIDKPSIAEL